MTPPEDSQPDSNFFRPKSDLVSNGDPRARKLLCQNTWNNAASRLDSKSDAYGSIRSELEDWERDLEIARERRNSAEQKEAKMKVTVSVLGEAAKLCGAQETVGASFHVLPDLKQVIATPNNEAWGVEIESGWGFKLLDNGELYISNHDQWEPVENFDTSPFILVGPIDACSSWAEEVARYNDKWETAKAKTIDEQREVATLAYRIQILGSVLYEFRKSRSVEKVRLVQKELDDTLAKFAIKTWEIMEIDEKVAKKVDKKWTNRNQVLLQVEAESQWSFDYCKEMAMDLLAYNEKKGRGRLSSVREEKELKHFWDVLEELQEKANKFLKG